MLQFQLFGLNPALKNQENMFKTRNALLGSFVVFNRILHHWRELLWELRGLLKRSLSVSV